MYEKLCSEKIGLCATKSGQGNKRELRKWEEINASSSSSLFTMACEMRSANPKSGESRVPPTYIIVRLVQVSFLQNDVHSISLIQN